MHSEFLHVFFSWLDNSLFFIIWICQHLCNLSSLEGHIGCFQVLTVMNKAAVHTICRFLCEHNTSTYLVKYQKSTIAGPYHKSMVCLVRTHQTNYLSKWLYHSVFSLVMSEHYCCSTFSLVLGVPVLIDVVVSH